MGLLTLGSFGLVPGQSLGDYQWKKRIVLIDIVALSHEALDLQLRLAQGPGYAERDILVLVHHNGTTYDANLKAINLDLARVRHELGKGEDQLLLIGKDGTIKLRHTLPTEDAVLFHLIDQMPMRRSEMRNEKKKKK
ncbi:MAG: DUF4174 domain-containing protein [Saprospiraceae bacterium]|nr:DUF4174 domain-containing protein [Saprospiraceae bacterium]